MKYHADDIKIVKLIDVLLIAVVKTIRVILTYIQKKVSRIQSTLAKAVLMSLQCW